MHSRILNLGGIHGAVNSDQGVLLLEPNDHISPTEGGQS